MSDLAEQEREKLSRPRPDLDRIVSLAMLREHARIDDVETVSDAVLDLYRKAAISAAERYTGLLLGERKVITESVQLTEGVRRIALSHAAISPYVYVYGPLFTPAQRIMVSKGAREIVLAHRYYDLSSGCCNPCATDQTPQTMLMYTAGFDCESEVPPEIALGVMKYVAHVIENHGDNITKTTASGKASDDSRGLVETNNPALASGAIEIWRSAVPDLC